jgi:hypothetical protein
MAALQIKFAVYGNGNSCIDVTNSVQRIVDEGNDDVYVMPSTFNIPYDPAFGIQKQFIAWYTRNGKLMGITGLDGETVDLAP